MELYQQLLALAEQGEGLLEEMDSQDNSSEYQKWMNSCYFALSVVYSRNSEEVFGFQRSPNKDSKISTLKMLAAKEKTKVTKNSNSNLTVINQLSQNQLVTIRNEISLQILLSIENSKELSDDQKREVREIFEDVKSEVEKSDTDWEKVKGLLKRSIDYGLKIAPDIVKLADAYFRAKH